MHASVRLAALAMSIHAFSVSVHAQSIDGGGAISSSIQLGVPSAGFLDWTITRNDYGPLEILDIFRVTSQAVPPAEVKEAVGYIPDNDDVGRTSLTLKQAAMVTYLNGQVTGAQGEGGVALIAARSLGVGRGGTLVLTDWRLDVDTLSVTVDAQIQPLNAAASAQQDVQLFSLSNRRVGSGVTLFDASLTLAGVGLMQAGWGSLTLGNSALLAAAPDFGTIAVVPEPAAIALTVTGLAVVGVAARRRVIA